MDERLSPTRDAQLNVYNVATLRAEPPDRFDHIRFDPNNTCNVHCVYCHNHRSDVVVPTEELQAFLDENVLYVGTFQMGCVMEPTLDKRLGDLLLLVARSRVPPARAFVLQTNGILLHMHDPAKFCDAGLTHLSVSIDAADPKVHRALRGGTSIAKVGRNIANFTKNCPDAAVRFITTVTRLNLSTLDSLVRFGMDLGVRHFTFREVFYRPDSDVVDHSRMPDLVLRPGEFAEVTQWLRSMFADHVAFDFADEEMLQITGRRMTKDSRR